MAEFNCRFFVSFSSDFIYPDVLLSREYLIKIETKPSALYYSNKTQTHKYHFPPRDNATQSKNKETIFYIPLRGINNSTTGARARARHVTESKVINLGAKSRVLLSRPWLRRGAGRRSETTRVFT